MVNAKTKELFKDEAFLEELAKTKNAEEAQKLITEKGGEISIEELNALRASSQSGELNDEALENVAGGNWSWISKLTRPLFESIPW